MRKTAAPLPILLLSLACALASAGCRGAGTQTAGGGEPSAADAGEVIKSLGAFTEELASKVETARDTKAGLADAQRLLDERRAALASSIAALRASPQVKSDARARAGLLEAEVDNTERVHRLQVKYSDDSTRDPDLKARLDRLVADYDSIFK
jgi:ABC-type transporter Mla subunit MlaD